MKNNTQYGNTLKKFLHSKIGARIGYFLRIKGFNRIEARINGKNPVFSYNSRVNKGSDLIASLITGISLNSISSPLPPKYIALSTTSLTPNATDTTLSGETSATGLARALGSQGTYTSASVLDGPANYFVSNLFTNSSGGTVTIQSTALFDATSSGNMFVEGNLGASATLLNGDTLSISWQVYL